jgi:hypothetical protein
MSNRNGGHSPMEYTPAEILRQRIQEMALSRTDEIDRPAGIFRGLKATEAKKDGDNLIIGTSTLSAPLTIPLSMVMVFGDERITAGDYARRVIERDDQLDAVLLPKANGVFPIFCYWIRIVYVGEPLDPRTYAKKDDGLFAMRAKSGEKAERIVARHLRDNGGHIYPINSRESPGYFEIRYAGKKKREPDSPDRRCTVCGLSIEIKKRNKDQKFRVSHSEGRPFSTENAPDGWHAFVFPDMKPRFVSNAVIAQAIAEKRCRVTHDRYDSWAEIDADAIVIGTPPACTVVF